MATSFNPAQLERLRREAKKLGRDLCITHSEALDRIAAQQGFRNWSPLAKRGKVDTAGPPLQPMPPVTAAEALDPRKRYYLHGDVAESNPTTCYCARCDVFFEPSHFEAHPWHKDGGDGERYLLAVERWNRRTAAQKAGWRRPDDAPNVLAAKAITDRENLKGLSPAGKRTYWTTERPSGAKRWAGMACGAVLPSETYRDRLHHLYRRYVKQWNDIELDHGRELSEHTHQVCGAKVVGSNNSFIVTARSSEGSDWLLQVMFARGFHQFYPGMSMGRNTMRSEADIKAAILHWVGDGESEFKRWLETEEQTKSTRGEWTEYRA